MGASFLLEMGIEAKRSFVGFTPQTQYCWLSQQQVGRGGERGEADLYYQHGAQYWSCNGSYQGALAAA
jgi:hypothetical protein